ncbi:hypothetical protein D3C72_745780 [compost metagenome]
MGASAFRRDWFSEIEDHTALWFLSILAAWRTRLGTAWLAESNWALFSTQRPCSVQKTLTFIWPLLGGIRRSFCMVRSCLAPRRISPAMMKIGLAPAFSSTSVLTSALPASSVTLSALAWRASSSVRWFASG